MSDEEKEVIVNGSESLGIKEKYKTKIIYVVKIFTLSSNHTGVEIYLRKILVCYL